MTVAGAQAEFDDWLVASRTPRASRAGARRGVIRPPSIWRSACGSVSSARAVDWEVTVRRAIASGARRRAGRGQARRHDRETKDPDYAPGHRRRPPTPRATCRRTTRGAAAASELTLAFEGASTPPRADASASVIEAALARADGHGVRVARDDDAARRGGGRAWAVSSTTSGRSPFCERRRRRRGVVVSRKRAGAATSKQITARVEGGNAEVIQVVVRPKVKAPKLRLAAAEVVAGREDEVVAGLFDGVELEAAGVVAVEAACERGPCAFLVPTVDGVEAVLAANSVRLRGLVRAFKGCCGTRRHAGADVDASTSRCSRWPRGTACRARSARGRQRRPLIDRGH